MGFSETIAPLHGYIARGNVRPIFTSCWKGQYRHSGRMRSTVTSISSRSSLVSSVLSHVTWQSVVTGEKTRFEAEQLFMMIGADPCTTWLRDCVDLDANGFVRTSF